MLKNFRKRRQLHIEDGGFSLIELIVAVAILGLVAVPLVNMFVYAGRTESKAGSHSHAEDMAESISESLNAQSLANLLPESQLNEGGNASTRAISHDELTGDWNLSAGGSDTKGTSEASGDQTVITLTDLQSGGKKFDSVITLDPGDKSSSTTGSSGTGASSGKSDAEKDRAYYGSANNKKIVKYSRFTHVYCQPDGTTQDPDVRAEAKYVNQGTIVAKRRTVELTLRKKKTGTGTDQKIIVSPELIYHYRFRMQGSNDWKEDTETAQGLSDFEYDPEKKFSLFLFIKPYYEGTAVGNGTTEEQTGVKDNFLIINNPAPETEEDQKTYVSGNLEGRIYLMKLKDKSLTDSALESKEGGYSAQISLKENHASGEEMSLKVPTNLNLFLTDSGKSPSEKRVIPGTFFVRNYRSTDPGNTGFSQSPMDNSVSGEDRNFIDYVAHDRIFQVTIDIYEHKSDGSRGRKLYTLNGSKLG